MSKQGTRERRGGPAAALAEFVADLSTEDVPEAGLRLAERCFVDTIGVTLAGAVDETGAAAAAAMSAAVGAPETDSGTGARGAARLLGRDGRADPATAAFINGTAGHALDYDDVCLAMSGHPSVVLVPTALAVGEGTDATGRDLLAAYVAGFETMGYLGAPILPDHYERGWHATATLGVFGAAAASAHLMELDAAEARHALNVAASFPAGLKRNFGTPTKPAHAGQAARSGVTAALLAAEGFSADPGAIDGERGFYDLYADDEPAFDAAGPLGERWAIVEDGVGVKKYPCCYFTHSSIEAASRLAGEHDLAPDDVASVEVEASRGAADALHHADPETGLQGKFSMEYAVASALARERVGLGAFEDDAVDDPAVQAVRERVEFSVNPDLDYGSKETVVTVETLDGDSHALGLDGPPGSHDDPLSDAELEAKFVDCASRAVDPETAAVAYGRLDSLRERSSVDEALAGL